MKSNFTTFILFLIMLILIIGIIIFGKAIYTDLFDSNQVTYKVDSIATEEPEEDDSEQENIAQSISNSIQSVFNNNSKKEINPNIYDETVINKFFYNQLNNNQKIIYSKLQDNKQNLKQGNYVINFDNAFSQILSQEGGSEELSQDYQTAIEAFTHDNPDLFYLDVNKMYLNIKTIKRFLITTYDVYISAAENSTYLSDDFTNTEQIEKGIKAIEEAKNIIVSKVKGNDYEKILFIHDFLLNNVEYDSTYSKQGTYGVYGTLIGKQAVCEGYAKTFKYLANAVGIECEIMQGTATNSKGKTESHAWNCVKLGDTWYEIDCTWDDPIIIGNGKVTKDIKYKYFLKGENTFNKDHTLSHEFSDGGKEFAYPEISKKDY